MMLTEAEWIDVILSQEDVPLVELTEAGRFYINDKRSRES